MRVSRFSILNTPITKPPIRHSARTCLKMWVDAFRAEGLKIGFYYSLIDWHHPQYTIDRVHPQSVNTQAEYDALNKNRDMAKYREYLKNQVKEILTNYGKIDILWLDFSFPGEFGKGRDDWGSVELMKMVRELQPGILVNDRADLKDYAGGWDFTTPEQFKVPEWPTIDGKKFHGKPARHSPDHGATTAMSTPGKTPNNCSYC
jgi:alpha-L-fucosidase